MFPLYNISLFTFNFLFTTPKDLVVGIFKLYKASLPKCSLNVDLNTALPSANLE